MSIKVRFLLFTLILCAGASPLRSADTSTPEPPSGWLSLFNGRNFDGWYRYLDRQGKDSDPEHVFQIKDRIVKVYHDHAAGVLVEGGYIASRDEFSYYHLRFEYKWGKKKFSPRTERPRDAGLIYHFVGPDRVWPRGIECQVQENDTGDCFTVNGTRLTTTIDPRTADSTERRYCDAAQGGIPRNVGGSSIARIIKDGTYEKLDDWNTVEVIVEGAERVTHIVNGHVNFRGTDLRQVDENGATTPLTHGRILLQAEYAEVCYRNIEIRPIASGPLHPPAGEPAISLRVPPGFEVTRVAAAPLVNYPTLACLDDRGRLYASEGAGINAAFDELERTLPRSIRRLEDTDGDGVFDRSTLFADKMTFPYGGVWHDGALYVASPPNIWRLEDTDGDGVADRRDVVVSGFRSQGLSSCMKGAYLAPDGWLYFCGGNEGGYDLRAADDRRLRDDRSSPAVFRVRPDGTQMEVVATGGAGVYDLCFHPGGDILGIVTIMKYPRGDGIIHWAYGGTYPSSRPLSRAARLTGDRLPPMRDWGQTSPSGMMRYESTAFGEEYQGNIFTAHFNTHKVTRDVVERQGGTWQIANEEDFVTSDDPYCFLTDVLEDADGSILVVETGAWFHIGCPLSPGSDQPWTGGIYRIRKTGAAGPPDPRGATIAWDNATPPDLAALLDDQRPVVRDRAVAALAARGAASLPALRAALAASSADARRNAVWALTRIDSAEARTAVRDALKDADATVAQAAIHSAGLWRDEAALAQIIPLLASEHPFIRREAAGALGRLGNASAVPVLWEAIAVAPDRFVEHALIYALLELSAGQEAIEALNHADPKVRRAALVVLEHVSKSPLNEKHLTPLLASSDRIVQRAALEVAIRHRGWTKGVAKLLEQWLAASDPSNEERATLYDALVAMHGDARVHKLIGEVLSDEEAPPKSRLLALDVVARSYAKAALPEDWQRPLRCCLAAQDEMIAERAISTIDRVGRHQFDGDLEALSLDSSRPRPLRVAAAVTVIDRDGPSHPAMFEFLARECCAEATDPLARLTICRALADARMSASQMTQITALVAAAGPLELPLLLGAFEEPASPEIGAALVAALRNSPSASTLPAGCIERLFSRYPQAVQELAAPLLEHFAQERAERTARLDELKFALDGGDAARGHEVFFHKASCFACHRVGKEGSSVGPELSKIANVRTRRDLLEAVAFPSATFARGFEPCTIVTNSAHILTGIIRSETRDTVQLLTAERSERSIPRDEIEEVVPCRVSIMPQGLDRAMSADDLRDLLAFLSSLKDGDKN